MLAADPSGNVLLLATVILGLLLLGAGLYRRPDLVLLGAVPVLMWPATVEIGGLPLFAPMLALVEVVIVVSCLRHLRTAWKPTVLALLLIVLLGIGLVVFPEPQTVSGDEARNSFISFALTLLLIPAATLARPQLLTSLKVVGVSGVAASAYLLANVDYYEGRASLETYNADALGMAAGISIVALTGTWLVTRTIGWLAAAAVPFTLFVESQTRAALVVIGVGLVCIWILSLVGIRRLIATVVSLSGLVIVLAGADALQRALFTGRQAQDFEVQSRFDALATAVRTAFSHPLLGVGWRHLPEQSLQQFGTALNAHNDFVLVAAEGGLLAFAVLGLLVSRAFTVPVIAPEVRAVKATCIAALSALAFGNLLADVRVILPAWVLLGVLWTVTSSKPAGVAAEGTSDPSADETSDLPGRRPVGRAASRRSRRLQRRAAAMMVDA